MPDLKFENTDEFAVKRRILEHKINIFYGANCYVAPLAYARRSLRPSFSQQTDVITSFQYFVLLFKIRTYFPKIGKDTEVAGMTSMIKLK